MQRQPSSNFSFVKLALVSLLSLTAFFLLLLPAILNRKNPLSSNSYGELELIVVKYFPDDTGNWTRKQISDALSMEMELLTFEHTRLLSDIQLRNLSMMRKQPTKNSSSSTSLLIQKLFLPTIRNLRKNFLEMFGMATGAAIQLNTLTEDASKLTQYEFNGRRKDVSDINRLLAKSMEKLSAPFNQWRKLQAAIIADKIRERFHLSQNPFICDPTKFIICDAFSSTKVQEILESLVTCSTMAFTSNKTLLFSSRRVTDLPRGTFRWNDYLLTPSPKCQWITQTNNTQTVRGTGNFEIPKDYKDLIENFHPDAVKWWTGQMLHNTWSLRPDLHNELQQSLVEMKFQLPIVGLHIQQSSRNRSSSVLDEYMAVVEEYYQGQDSHRRQLYVASDIPVIYAELRLRYPQYTVFSSRDVILRMNAKYGSRNDAIHRSITDLFFLERTSRLICATTSKLCRMADALIHTDHTKYFDAKQRLDLVDL